MKCLLVSLAAVFFLPVVSIAQPKVRRPGCQVRDEKVRALAGGYKELRERRRLLPAGTFDRELSGHGGRLHAALASLGVALGRPPFTKRIITRCLGQPDDVKTGEQMGPFLETYDRELRKTGRRKASRKKSTEYLIYHWRGGHDFMFFVSERGGGIVGHGWWFAYE